MSSVYGGYRAKAISEAFIFVDEDGTAQRFELPGKDSIEGKFESASAFYANHKTFYSELRYFLKRNYSWARDNNIDELKSFVSKACQNTSNVRIFRIRKDDITTIYDSSGFNPMSTEELDAQAEFKKEFWEDFKTYHLTTAIERKPELFFNKYINSENSYILSHEYAAYHTVDNLLKEFLRRMMITFYFSNNTNKEALSDKRSQSEMSLIYSYTFLTSYKKSLLATMYPQTQSDITWLRMEYKAATASYIRDILCVDKKTKNESIKIFEPPRQSYYSQSSISNNYLDVFASRDEIALLLLSANETKHQIHFSLDLHDLVVMLKEENILDYRYA